MATEPIKTSLDSEAVASIPDYFYEAASVIESDRYRWVMQDLDRIEVELQEKFAHSNVLHINLAVKRLIDIVGSFFLIVVLAPVLLMTALAVKLTSPGPIFFSHKRWAMNQCHFICLKFRSMRTDQDKLLNQAEVDAIQKTGTLLKLKEDPRLTSIGSFIRKTSIDELPQLFNVLKGDMSLVGPRPLVLHMMQPYPKVRRVRCLMRPGISGLWQIRDRENNTSVISMMPHDLEYLLNYNVWLDVKILLATVPAVLWGTGAV
jgi:lipopolysaccharide/colanic/teichoic acid biosynthesis glycosyltransferase